LQQEIGLDEDVREAALVLARERRDNATDLNNASWKVVREAGAAADRYQQALRAAQAACRLTPGNGGYLTTLAVAHYRAGQYPEALATLTQAEPLNAKRYDGPIPSELAFQALALFQLGQKDRAAATLARLRERMKDPRWAGDKESQDCLREAETLLEGKPPGKMSYADP
jgi:tetratricopeptide (TPR) repeat protein